MLLDAPTGIPIQMPAPFVYGAPTQYSAGPNPEVKHAEDEIPSSGPRREMPDHWDWNFDMGYEPLTWSWRITVQVLCLTSFGHYDMNEVWKLTLTDALWREHRERLSNRIANIVVLGGLLLATYAAFVTTNPPVQNVVDYTAPQPYVCLLWALGMTMGGLVAGTTIHFVFMAETPAWYFREVLMGSRFSIVCTMMILGYPFAAVGTATFISSIGLILAAIQGDNGFVGRGAVFLVLLPKFFVLLFMSAHIHLLYGPKT